MFTCCGVSCCKDNHKVLPDANISQEEVKGLYNSIAPFYDLWGKLAETRARERAIELANIKNNQSILEVAVGTGLAFREIVKRNPDGVNIGLDISEGMLKKAKKKLKKSGENFELKVGSAYKIPYEDETFDVIVNNYMFDLIPFNDMVKILQEFKRVLKNGGTLILVNMTEGERFGSNIYNIIYQMSPKTIGGCRGVKMADYLEVSNFLVEKREYYQQFLFPSEVIKATKK